MALCSYYIFALESDWLHNLLSKLGKPLSIKAETLLIIILGYNLSHLEKHDHMDSCLNTFNGSLLQILMQSTQKSI